MRIQFDVEKSIQEKRLIRSKQGFWQKFENIYFFIGSYILGSLASILALKMLQLMVLKGFSLFMLFALFLPFSLVGFLCYFAFIRQNKLVQFSGPGFEQNFKAIVEVLEEKFHLEIPKTTGEIIRIHTKPTYWKCGIRVIVIVRDETIYINIARFNFWGDESPFHSFSSYLKTRAIVKEFQYKLGSRKD